MTSDWSDGARAVLAQRVQRRMDELGIDTAVEMIHRAGVAPTTWYRLEQAKTVASRTYRKVDAALEWQRGSCEAILAGGEPTPVDAGPPVQAAPGNDMVLVPREALVLIRDTLAQLEQRVTAEIERNRETDNRIITARRQMFTTSADRGRPR